MGHSIAGLVMIVLGIFLIPMSGAGFVGIVLGALLVITDPAFWVLVGVALLGLLLWFIGASIYDWLFWEPTVTSAIEIGSILIG